MYWSKSHYLEIQFIPYHDFTTVQVTLRTKNGHKVGLFKPSHPVHFRKLYLNKIKLKLLFSHFFVVSQKVL